MRSDRSMSVDASAPDLVIAVVDARLDCRLCSGHYCLPFAVFTNILLPVIVVLLPVACMHAPIQGRRSCCPTIDLSACSALLCNGLLTVEPREDVSPPGRHPKSEPALHWAGFTVLSRGSRQNHNQWRSQVFSFSKRRQSRV